MKEIDLYCHDDVGEQANCQSEEKIDDFRGDFGQKRSDERGYRIGKLT